MDRNGTVSYCLEALKKAGADKASCSLNMSEKKELNVEIGEMTLFRTTYNSSMGITVIKDQKKGSISINKTDQDCIDVAVEQVMEMSKGSQPDEAYDIAEQQPPQVFSKGDESANLDNMYKSLKEFVEYVKSIYPMIQIEQAIMDFNHTESIFIDSPYNSCGMDITLAL